MQMLVLARKTSETIVFIVAGSEVHLKILEIRKNGEIKIGIEAPQSVKILREELKDGKEK
jgi:carbon storage regulator CsrA